MQHCLVESYGVIYEDCLIWGFGFFNFKKSIFNFNKYTTTRITVTKTEAKHQHILGFLNRDIKKKTENGP